MKIPKFVCAVLTLIAATAVFSFAGERLAVLHSFAGGAASGNPAFQLVEDSSGNLYGTTFWGGNMAACEKQGCGVAYRLSPNGNAWKYTELFRFVAKTQGTEPTNLILDAAGNLYGELSEGGADGSGSVFELSPTTSGPWTYTTLYAFTGGSDGQLPNGGLVFDAAGNLYGTTHYGGNPTSEGVVFKLSPQAGGGWTESVIWNFPNNSTGYYPNAGLIFDAAGNLYGTTAGGNGGVFKLTEGSSGWSGSSLYAFTGGSDGAIPEAGLTIDASGNLYGTTIQAGVDGKGTVFELSPNGSGGYTFDAIHAFNGHFGGVGSYYGLAIDPSGNLFGATNGGKNNDGVIFELSNSSGTWDYSVLHTFQGTDGQQPNTLILDAAGNLYGVANYGDVAGCINASGCGDVFKLSQVAAAADKK
jgi:uncharacterized repeat protein (TIGR03803 family)